MCSDRDHAGVPGPPFWRREDQNLPGCPLAAAVGLHKDLSRPHPRAPPSSGPVLAFMTDLFCSLPRPTSTPGPCSSRCVWAGTCTCPRSSCWWSPPSTPLQVTIGAKPQRACRSLSMFQLRFTHLSTVVSGGLAAVIYTDTLQTFVMIIGAIILTIMGLLKNKNKQNHNANPASLSLNLQKFVFPRPQLSTRLEALGTWSRCTARRCPVKSFRTAPATSHARTPCTCSGTPSPETCLGLA